MRIADITVEAYSGYEREKEFNLGTNFITSMYVDYLPLTKTDNIKKIVIEAIKEDPANKIETLLDILVVHQKFNFEMYWGQSKNERKKTILEFMQGGLLDSAIFLNLPVIPFEQAFKRVVELGIVNERFVGKRVVSPDRTRVAQLFYVYDADKAKVFIVITDRANKVIQRNHVSTTSPHEIFFFNFLGRLRWKSPTLLILKSRDDSQEWNFDLNLSATTEM